MIELDTNASLEAKTFDLDVNSYDGSTGAFFENKMLWVSAVKVVPDAGSITEIRFDEKLVWTGLVAGEGIDLSGVGYENSTPVMIPPSNVESKYGVKFLPIRNKFSIQNTTGANVSKVFIWGVYTRRTA